MNGLRQLHGVNASLEAAHCSQSVALVGPQNYPIPSVSIIYCCLTTPNFGGFNCSSFIIIFMIWGSAMSHRLSVPRGAGRGAPEAGTRERHSRGCKAGLGRRAGPLSVWPLQRGSETSLMGFKGSPRGKRYQGWARCLLHCMRASRARPRPGSVWEGGRVGLSGAILGDQLWHSPRSHLPGETQRLREPR